MQPPFWLPVWRTADALLGVATSAAVVLPVMALLALLLVRRRSRAAFARAGRLFLSLGLATPLFGLLAVAGAAFVSLRLLPASVEGLEPLPFEPLSGPWLAPSTAFLSWAGGLLLLLLCRRLASPVFSAAAFETDAATANALDRRALWAAGTAFVAFLLLFASTMLRLWPFLGLPESMTTEDVFVVLLSNSWRMSCAALMPAGAMAALAFFLQLPPLPSEVRALERRRRREESIPGTAEEAAPFSQDQTLALRLCTAFALAGAAFQILDAGFLAFTPGQAFGSGPGAQLLRFGPVLVTGLCIACWAFLFAKPRRMMFLQALVPVLLIFLRAAARF